MNNRDSNVRIRRVALHGLRVFLFTATICLIHLQHNKIAARNETNSVDISRDVASRVFPEAHSLHSSTKFDGCIEVRDQKEQLLGHILQTSPQCDSIVGFSGPTNTLIAISPNESTNDSISHIQVLTSNDTKEHVAQVEASPNFYRSFEGVMLDDLAEFEADAVSGATLTSRAIAESVFRRLKVSRDSLRFPQPINLENAQQLFPKAAFVVRDDKFNSLWTAKDKKGRSIGSLLRTSPAADNLVGFQGPNDSLLGIDLEGQIVGCVLLSSYDNEPYVGYVKNERSFASTLNGFDLNRFSELDLGKEGIEGVSGATMTSQTMIEGAAIAARRHIQDIELAQRKSLFSNWRTRDFGTTLIVVLGLFVGLTSLRGNRVIRVAFQLALIVYLGLINGDMVSQAMLAGWAKHGVPWQSAIGLVVLTVAAFCIPVFTKRNIYCSHLCPHGALQELVKRRTPWQLKLSRNSKAWLKKIPAAILLWGMLVAMLQLGFSLVDIEPFNAWVFGIAGLATVSIAVVGLFASLFVPMAYCQYGCPTGALLKFLRSNASSHHWTSRDTFAVCLTAMATGIWLFYG